jgi:GT2 family glycosyltransferase
MPPVGTVIVAWNSAAHIRDCLAAIPAEYRTSTVVIDNHSSDMTAEIVRTGFREVRLIVNPTNAGFARAGNQGVAATNADHVLILNPDTRLPAGGVAAMLTWLTGHPDVGILAPKLVNPDGTAQPSVRRLPTYANMLRVFLGNPGDYRMAGFDYSATQEVEQPMASCWLVRRKVIDAVGLFDEQFPLFFNDVDYCRRVLDAGWKIVYFPEVAVWHQHGASTGQRRSRAILDTYQALFRYLRKYDRSGWFWLKGVPLAIGLELVALVKVIAARLHRNPTAS